MFVTAVVNLCALIGQRWAASLFLYECWMVIAFVLSRSIGCYIPWHGDSERGPYFFGTVAAKMIATRIIISNTNNLWD